MKIRLSLAALILLAGSAFGAPTTTLNLPARSPSAMTGSQFYNYILNMTNAQREQAIINEIATGNVPSFLRTLKPITVNATINSVQHTATYYVTCDYTAIGSDSDFFRMPMSAPLAQQVADIAGCSLPTRKMVNDIYTAAEVKLAPYPFSPATYVIDSVEVFWLSQQAIETQRTGHANGLLVGGIKKDVVITPQLSQRPAPARVAIYGWHQLNGTPIQPLSLVHESTYEDYSHGIRLIGKVATVDGADKTIPATIGDANTSALLSDEGVFTVETVYPVPNPYPLPGAPNLVINGSFENGFVSGVGTAWTSWTALGTVTFGQASLNKVDGSYAQYWAINSTTPFDAGVYQTIAVTPGATYRIQGQIKRQSLFPATLMQFGYDLSGGTSGTAGSVVYTTLTGTTDNTWTAYDQSTVATGPNITIFARGGHSDSTGAANSYFYLDAISMVKTADPAASPTPSPTATAAPSATPSPTATAAPSPTASLTPTPSPTPQVTQSPVENTTFLTY